jgi:hypothetical protein
MENIIYFNHLNITNKIDKAIFNNYYPSDIFTDINKIKLMINRTQKPEFFMKTLWKTHIQFTENDVLQLFNFDYVIFLKSKFTKTKLLKYFRKANVLYFDYNHREHINHTLQILNFFIKEAPQTDIATFIKNANIKQINKIYFLNNEFEPNMLYKKINFSDQYLFLPFNIYAIKKVEYKLRSFCQIAEKMGAEQIVIKYDSLFLTQNQISIKTTVLDEIANLTSKTVVSDNNNVSMTFTYPKKYSNLNLNKDHILNRIHNADDFMIQTDDFDSDIDLKLLIDARCINLIQRYNTSFIVNCINENEYDVMLKIKDYGVNIDYLNKTEKNVKIHININFMNIYENPSCIDGTNIYMKKEGFIHLIGIINQELPDNINSYKKINNYLRSHLDYIDTQKQNLLTIKSVSNVNEHYDKIKEIFRSSLDVPNYLFAYNTIIGHFDDNEITVLYHNYFNNNMTYNNFIAFKKIIIYGDKIKSDKLFFIASQYHRIVKYKYTILYIIEQYINKVLNTIGNLCVDSFSYDIELNVLNEEYIKYKWIINNFNNNKYNSIAKDLITNKFFSRLFFNHFENGLLYDIDINSIKQYGITYFRNKINTINKNIIIDGIIENFFMIVLLDVLELIQSDLQEELKIHMFNTNIINILSDFFDETLYEQLDTYFHTYDKFLQLKRKYKNKLPINKISKDKLQKNYAKYKIFYTWDDMMKTFNEFSMLDKLPPPSNKNMIPIPYCRLSELVSIEQQQCEKFKIIIDNDTKEELYYGPLDIDELEYDNYTNYNCANTEKNMNISLRQSPTKYR